MKPVIALIGRPNVGKSSLFNRLTRTRDALVVDQPGVTRDRRYGLARLEEKEFILIDTGGIILGAEGLDEQVSLIAMQAVNEADLVLFMVDGKNGLTSEDQAIADKVRALNKDLMLLVNKTERMEKNTASAEFYSLGLGQPFCISATQGEGIAQLGEEIVTHFPDLASPASEEEGEEEQARKQAARVAIVGRPNVGKSTLVNRLLGEERVLAFDAPG
ncbi:MAG: 50S ribosome-binding GTPase, partial [Gammaproteobacteria bacterium]|nr:50S ribosome-binding GTPase [Gammaproteobacteria bacterium]